LGVEAYSEFLQEDLADFLKMNIATLPNAAEPTVDIFYNFVDGAYVELKSESAVPYKVSFIDVETGVTHFSTTLTSGHWAKTSIQYFKNWRIEIWDPFNNLIEAVNYDATGQQVYIALESKALGDTFAWLPYVEEFRKKHNCTVMCSTFHNGLFEKTYPEIKFIEPGSRVNNVYAVYRLGWFNKDDRFDSDRNPRDFKLGPLQRTATDILGLEYSEIKPLIGYPARKLTKKVGLGIHSTAQAKYWNNSTGWQEVTNWLIKNGYEPVILSREEDGYMGNPNPVGAVQLVPGPLESVIHELSECQAFIGISSGLTWLAWATDTPTVQISGFTEPFNEPNEGIVKVSAPSGACSGCANRARFDAGDWNWCPDQKGTDRQFECSKLIRADEVIAKLKEILV
jgi:autotransporter strand-loop-strand O-heptosyltransferase